jgi:hypothetical protein
MGQEPRSQRPWLAEFGSAAEYNRAHPEAAMPASADERNVLRSFTCAGAGCEDDVLSGDATFTLDFLPGGAPAPGEPDRAGIVVASRWGNPPYLVLAHGVSLRGAWAAIVERWPSTLSAAAATARSLPPQA